MKLLLTISIFILILLAGVGGYVYWSSTNNPSESQTTIYQAPVVEKTKMVETVEPIDSTEDIDAMETEINSLDVSTSEEISDKDLMGL